MPILDPASENPTPVPTSLEEILQANRRMPEVEFGRCAITGEWSKCITVDLGDMSILHPGYMKHDSDGSEEWIEPETVVYSNQVTLSTQGLDALKGYLESQDNPIPLILPNLVYQWFVIFRNGESLTQFHYDETGSIPVEEKFPLDRITDIIQVSLQPIEDTRLPNYSFVWETGLFYCNGQLLDTGYEDVYNPAKALPINTRFNSVMFASAIKPNGLGRFINHAHNVTYSLGWIGGAWDNKEVPRNLIAIDSTGEWREYDQITVEEAIKNKVSRIERALATLLPTDEQYAVLMSELLDLQESIIQNA